jgi:predicted aconitase
MGQEDMRLTDHEQSMLDGAEGPAKQKALELLVRYAQALGADRFVDVSNIAGVPGSSTLFLHNYYKDRGGGSFEDVFARFDLDSDHTMEIPPVGGSCCHLQGGVDPEHWAEQGASREAFEHQQADEAEVRRHGIQVMKTCTPYLAGNMPAMGEHCAWMESSAVVFCNSVVGARTNTEGRESTSAAMLTGKVPDWGFHREEYRHGTHLVEVEVPVESVMDWGMLGYYIGDVVQENIPVVTGRVGPPDVIRHKHFGAAAASSGGVEMYHIVGATPEAATLEQAFGPRQSVATFHYTQEERRRIYDSLNANGSNAGVDYVMLGCPHAALEQIEEAARLLRGQRIKTHLWMFTSRAVKSVADLHGYTKTIHDAGGFLMTDTCSAIGRMLPKGTKVVALDSAKQVHYLPAMMNVEAWFGSTEDCVRAALTGRWNGELR